jgi:hypothetical protein
MNGWMKRRIERSRARCDRPPTNPKPDRPQQATKQAGEQAAPPAQQSASS